jgi:serine/alanine racemase
VVIVVSSKRYAAWDLFRLIAAFLLVCGIAKLTGLSKPLISNSILHYLAVSLICFITAWIIVSLWAKVKPPTPSPDSRAWVEIDLSALQHNAKVLQEFLPEQCDLMAVVKSNAYGHGDIAVSKALNSVGIHAFAVATLAEGIHLRKNGIKGTILILGYTNPKDASCLVRYRLTQTIIDYTYAEALNESGKKISVHVKLDTGMHRLGIDSFNISEIERIYECKNLMFEGIFSHLSASDSLTEEDVIYTKLQIERFFETTSYLQDKGYPTGKLHIQASYGILNYPDLPCDYARAGIALYGVLSSNEMVRSEVDLQPVLSVKARVAMVKQIAPGESVSYGRAFTTIATMKIAVVTIGYADGIQRNLFKKDSYVLIHSKKAPIIGRICMDQLMIDVTDIEAVTPNDVVTLIGQDGDEQIRCEDFAEQCGTITNEILNRLGSRLNYKII